MPLIIEAMITENDSVCLLSMVAESMDLSGRDEASLFSKKSAAGYISKASVNKSEGCNECVAKERCTNAKGSRVMQVSKNFISYRENLQGNVS